MLPPVYMYLLTRVECVSLCASNPRTCCSVVCWAHMPKFILVKESREALGEQRNQLQQKHHEAIDNLRDVYEADLDEVRESSRRQKRRNNRGNGK